MCMASLHTSDLLRCKQILQGSTRPYSPNPSSNSQTLHTKKSSSVRSVSPSSPKSLQPRLSLPQRIFDILNDGDLSYSSTNLYAINIENKVKPARMFDCAAIMTVLAVLIAVALITFVVVYIVLFGLRRPSNEVCKQLLVKTVLIGGLALLFFDFLLRGVYACIFRYVSVFS